MRTMSLMDRYLYMKKVFGKSEDLKEGTLVRFKSGYDIYMITEVFETSYKAMLLDSTELSGINILDKDNNMIFDEMCVSIDKLDINWGIIY